MVYESGNPFIEKINSYVYFITLVNTKTIFAKTVSKYNFLTLIPEFLDGNRTLDDLKLEKTKSILKVYDVPLDRFMYSSLAFGDAIAKWKHIGKVVT